MRWRAVHRQDIALSLDLTVDGCFWTCFLRGAGLFSFADFGGGLSCALRGWAMFFFCVCVCLKKKSVFCAAFLCFCFEFFFKFYF